MTPVGSDFGIVSGKTITGEKREMPSGEGDSAAAGKGWTGSGTANNSGNGRAGVKSQPTPSFVDIMAEQLQEVEIEKEFTKCGVLALDDDLSEYVLSSDGSSYTTVEDCSKDHELALFLSQDPDCSSDAEMAQRLQREFDREDELSSQFSGSRNAKGEATGEGDLKSRF